MVDDEEELGAAVDRSEDLADRLARVLERLAILALVAECPRFADTLDESRLLDDRVGDDVLSGCGGQLVR